MIYFIRKSVDGPIKVGYTAASAQTRMAQLQVGHHEKLYLLGTIPGTISDEKSIHKELCEYRLEGEWFESKAELLETINDVIEHQRNWYYFRQVRFNKLDIECRGLKELIIELRKTIKTLEEENEQLKLKSVGNTIMMKARVQRQFDKMTAKNKKLEEEIAALKGA